MLNVKVCYPFWEIILNKFLALSQFRNFCSLESIQLKVSLNLKGVNTKSVSWRCINSQWTWTVHRKHDAFFTADHVIKKKECSIVSQTINEMSIQMDDIIQLNNAEKAENFVRISRKKTKKVWNLNGWKRMARDGFLSELKPIKFRKALRMIKTSIK